MNRTTATRSLTEILLRRSQKKRPPIKSRHSKRVHAIERLESRHLLAAAVWNNAFDRFDVNGDGNPLPTPIDALQVINELNKRNHSSADSGALPLFTNDEGDSLPFVDVSCDGIVSPIDALLVINNINSGKGNAHSDLGSGVHVAAACSPTLVESDQFKTEYVRRLEVPSADPVLNVVFQKPHFDLESTQQIRDAFEIVVARADGTVIAEPFAPGFEASFNLTEQTGPRFAEDGKLLLAEHGADSILSIPLAGVNAGDSITVSARLINNDDDSLTSVVFRGATFDVSSIVADSTEGLEENNKNLIGTAARSLTPREEFDVSTLEEISEEVVAHYGLASYDSATRTLRTHIQVTNLTSAPIIGRMIVAVDEISQSDVDLVEFDGYLPDGRPYFDFTQELLAAPLNAGQATLAREVAFANSSSERFDFSLSVYGTLETVQGAFSSTPEVIAAVGTSYQYVPEFANEDVPMRYSMVASPKGMEWNETTASYSWIPGTSDVGVHTVILRGENEFGDYSEQSWAVTVLESAAEAAALAGDTSGSETIGLAGSTAGTVAFSSSAGGGHGNSGGHGSSGGRGNKNKNRLEPVGEPIDEYYFSSSVPGWMENSDLTKVWVDDSDIAKLQSYQNGAWTIEVYFDGNNVSLTRGAEDVDAFSLREDGSILLSTTGKPSVPGVRHARPEDILLFVPDSLGENNTSGRWELYVDGSDVGINSWEGIDAISELPDGRLVVSTSRAGYLPGLSGHVDDSDLAILTLDSTGEDTSGTWDFYFDGSDASLTKSHEDIDGLSVSNDQSMVHMSVNSLLVAGHFVAKGGDVATYVPTSLGRDTRGEFFSELLFDESEFGLKCGWLDGFHYKGLSTVDEPPLVLPIADQSIDELSLWEFQLVAEDPDTAPTDLVWSLKNGPDGMRIDEKSGVISWTPSEEQGPGAYSVSVSVSDGTNTTDASFGVDVAEVNQVPEFTDFGTRRPAEGGLVTLWLTNFFYDSDLPEQTLTYSLAADAPDSMWLDSNDRRFRFQTSEEDGPGTFHIPLTATDSYGASAMQVFTVVVREVNEPPVLEPIEEQVVVIEESVTFQATATDPDLPANDLTYSLGDGAPAEALIDPTTGTFSWTPQAGDVGEWSFDVIVTDNGTPSMSDATGVSIIVVDTNIAPNFTSDPVAEVYLGQSYLYASDAFDEDGDTLTFSTVGGPAPLEIDPATGLLQWTPDSTDVGTHTVRLRVDDGRGGSDEQSYTLTVLDPPANRPPVITSVPIVSADLAPKIGDNSAQLVEFIELTPTDVASEDTAVFTVLPSENPELFGASFRDAVAVDFDRDAQANNIASGTTLSNEYEGFGLFVNDFIVSSSVYGGPASAPNATWTPELPGEPLEFEFLVPVSAVGFINTSPDQDVVEFLDGEGGVIFSTRDQDDSTNPDFDVDRFIGAVASEARLISKVRLQNNSGNLEIDEFIFVPSPATYQYPVQATDPDDDSMTFGLETAPSGMFIEPRSGLISWNPSIDQLGEHQVEIQVTDGRGGVATQSFVVHVEDGENNAPVIVSDPNTVTTSVSPPDPGDLDDVVQWSDGNGHYYGLTPTAMSWSEADTYARSLGGVLVSIGDASENAFVSQAFSPSEAYWIGLTSPAGNWTDPTTWSWSNGDSSIYRNWRPGQPDIGFNDGEDDRYAVINHLGNGAGLWDNYPDSAFQLVRGIVEIAANTYQYDVDAIDPDDDTLTYSLDLAPPGMTIDPGTGLISWYPDTNAGDRDVIVRVEDGRGGSDMQSYVIEVQESGTGEIRGRKLWGNADTESQFVSTSLSVAGVADPWLAGMPDGSTASSNDVAPDHSPAEVEGLPLVAGDTLTFEVSGGVAHGPEFELQTPDGGDLIEHFAGEENGIASLEAPISALVGVFLDATQPDTTDAPTALETVIDANRVTPSLKQPFFIGDGRTASGSLQEIVVPDGATRLYLGVMDGFGWYNNIGSLDVTVREELSEPRASLNNAIANGDFSESPAVFTTDLLENPDSLLGQGQYVIGTNPNDYNGLFGILGDHTSGDGAMLIVNGGAAVDQLVWSQEAAVSQGSTYEVSFYAASVFPDNPSTLEVRINGELVGAELNLTSTVGEWHEFTAVWESGVHEAATIEILNQSTEFQGNDFAIDDIALVSLEPEQGLPSWTIYLDQNNNGRLDVGERWTTTADKRVVREAAMYAIGDGRGDGSSNLYRIDNIASSPTVVDIGETGGIYADIAVNPVDGRLYVVSHVTGIIAEIDPSSGQVLNEWSTGLGGLSGLEFSEDGTLYTMAFGATTLFTIDLDASSGEIVNSLLDVGYGSLGDLAYENGALYLMASPKELVRIDLDTQQVTSVASYPNELPGLETGPNGVLYAAENLNGQVSQLYSIDKQTGELTLVGPIDGTSGVGSWGLTFDPGAVSQAGDYAFTGLPAGEYIVREVQQPGWVQVYPSQTALGPDLVTNGDFESGSSTSIYETFLAGSTIAPGWQVIQESVDVVHRDHFLSSTGSYSVDLTGTPGAGAISQVLSTTPGQEYEVVFDLAGNPQGDPLKHLRVAAGDQEAFFEFDTSPYSLSTLLFRQERFTFVADSHETELVFESLDAGLFGPAIDTVSVRALSVADYHIIRLNERVVVDGIDFVNMPIPSGGNRAAVFESSPPASIAVGDTLRYDASAVDPENDSITYDLPTAPSGMAVDPERGIVVWQPKASQLGTHQVVLRASDGNGGVALQSFEINVTDINHPPVITSNAPTEAVVDTPLQYDVRAFDANGDTISYSLLQSPEGMNIDAASGRLTWTPALAQVGSASVTVSVSDGLGGESIQVFDLAVVETGTNTNPVIGSAPRIRTRIEADYFYEVMATDPNADPLTFTLASAPAGMTIDQDGLVGWRPTADQIGEHGVDIQVSDGRGGVANQSFTLTVIATTENSPPEIVSEPIAGAVAGFSYEYQATAEDADGDPVRWHLSEAPAGMIIDPITGLIRWNPTSHQIGEHVVVLNAQDPQLSTGSQQFTLTVRATNTAPRILSSPPTDAAVATLYTYALETADAEGDRIAFSLSSAPDGMVIDAETGEITWTPTIDQIGNQQVVVLAADSSGVASQGFTIAVSGTPANLPPAFNTLPYLTARPDVLYSYVPQATDPEDGDAVTISMLTAPDGANYDNVTGLVEWVPSVDQTGTHEFVLQAIDSQGLGAVQRFLVEVAANTAPKIYSAPIGSVTANASYVYSLGVVDREGGPLGFEVLDGPTGLSIDGTGTVQWQPTTADLGLHTVTLQVTDDGDLTDTQTYELSVASDTLAPVVSLTATSNLIDLGSNLQLQVSATDNIAVDSLTVTVGGLVVPISDDGTALVPMTAPGLIDVVATATDAAGNAATDSLQVRVFDLSDTESPQVEIASPEFAASVTYLTDVVGSVSDDNLEFWRLEYARADQVDLNSLAAFDADYKLIAEGTTNVDNAVLGTFDPTLLSNDSYVLRLYAQDTNGLINTRGTIIGVSGEAKLGEFSLDFTDLQLPLAGVPITITRSYSTLEADNSGDFGYGWSLGIADGDIRETVQDGQTFRQGARVFLTNPSGQRIGFTFEPEPVSSFFGTYFIPKFTPDPGVTETLSVDESTFLGLSADGLYRVWFFNNVYNPNQYTLTTSTGEVYVYDQHAGVQTITDRSGNQLTFSNDGIVHTSGQSIDFIRDAEGRIEQIVAPDGSSLDYSYDANGDLVTFTDQIGLETQYGYLTDPAHFLDTIIDSQGRTVLDAEFDADGRLMGSTDALGNALSQSFDAENFTGTFTDANGFVTTFVYNERGNVLSETDSLGGVTTYEYSDPQNPDLETRIVDPNGNETLRTFDSRGNLLSTTNALGLSTTFAYNTANDLTSVIDALGHVTTLTYDSDGNLNQIIDAAGNSTLLTHDDEGRVTSQTDRNGYTTTFVYDAGCACGAPDTVINPDGSQRSYEYNQYGQITKLIDELGNEFLTEYDALGRQTKVTAPDGQSMTYVYDGQVLERQYDALGNTTRFEYDEANRVIRQIDAEGGVVEFRYDANGNRVLLQDPVGNITTWIYDSLDRMIEERDPFYNEGLTIEQALAELQIPSGGDVDTDTPAEHVRLYDYDAAGNQIEVIDRNGRRREFEYDALDRLTEESWFDADGGLANSIVSTYDAIGNLLTIGDSTSSYSYTYDILNRKLTEDNAGTPGIPNVILTFQYDAEGNRTQVADNFGVVVDSQYGSRNELLSKTWTGADIDDARIEFSYNGRLDRVEARRYADAVGGDLVSRSIYERDSSGRTIDIQHLDALDAVIADYDYDYDLADRLIQESHHGDTVNYSYDATGQLLDALHSDVAFTDEYYRYDANGNRTESHLHGTGYETGTANQLESDGEFTYEYDGEGNLVLKTDIATGDYTEYEYDHLNRLIRSTEYTSGGVIINEVEHRYDVFGRRLAETINGEATLMVYDGDNVWADFNGSGEVIARYLFGDRIDENLARYRPAEGTAWYLTDRLGSIRDLVNAAGALINHVDYDTYGNVLAQTDAATSDRFAFTGREFDSLSQGYYYRARFYDASVGRFNSSDPISFDSGDVNIFRYVYNTPNHGVDPRGLAGITGYSILTLSGVATFGFVLGASVDITCDFVKDQIANFFGYESLGIDVNLRQHAAIGLVTFLVVAAVPSVGLGPVFLASGPGTIAAIQCAIEFYSEF